MTNLGMTLVVSNGQMFFLMLLYGKVKWSKYPNHGSKFVNCLNIDIIISRFFINVQIQGQHPQQWDPLQVAGLLHA